MAMALSDCLAGGIADAADNTDYKNRMIGIINSCLAELYPYSSTAAVTAGNRLSPRFVTMLNDPVDLDDALARGVLVHEVIAMLFVNENPSLASFHEQKYLEKLARLKDIPHDFSAIEDVYPDNRMYTSTE